MGSDTDPVDGFGVVGEVPLRRDAHGSEVSEPVHELIQAMTVEAVVRGAGVELLGTWLTAGVVTAGALLSREDTASEVLHAIVEHTTQYDHAVAMHPGVSDATLRVLLERGFEPTLLVKRELGAAMLREVFARTSEGRKHQWLGPGGSVVLFDDVMSWLQNAQQLGEQVGITEYAKGDRAPHVYAVVHYLAAHPEQLVRWLSEHEPSGRVAGLVIVASAWEKVREAVGERRAELVQRAHEWLKEHPGRKTEWVGWVASVSTASELRQLVRAGYVRPGEHVAWIEALEEGIELSDTQHSMIGRAPGWAKNKAVGMDGLPVACLLGGTAIAAREPWVQELALSRARRRVKDTVELAQLGQGMWVTALGRLSSAHLHRLASSAQWDASVVPLLGDEELSGLSMDRLKAAHDRGDERIRAVFARACSQLGDKTQWALFAQLAQEFGGTLSELIGAVRGAAYEESDATTPY